MFQPWRVRSTFPAVLSARQPAQGQIIQRTDRPTEKSMALCCVLFTTAHSEQLAGARPAAMRLERLVLNYPPFLLAQRQSQQALIAR
jgi:hypothetical protein